MQAPALIPWAVFIANVQEQDVRALSLLASGDVVKTQNLSEAQSFQEQGVRLMDAGCLTRFRRSREVIGDQLWEVFDGRVRPEALLYVARCASERVTLSREPELPAAPVQVPAI